MKFRIADTFTDSLARLTAEEQKAVKTSAFDLQVNPANPGIQFHKISKTKDPNFWSVRASSDIRIIVHKASGSLLLCYVDHHDKAYQWAEKRKLERHPKTGAAQIVEIRETVRKIDVPKYIPATESEPVRPGLFENLEEDVLLGYGVPKEWLKDVRGANEDSLLILADHLPAEAAEALLEVATGGQPQMFFATPKDSDPFEHPDAKRRFRIMSDVDELSRALDYPWEKWTIFLHPAQRQIVEKEYSGSVRISGSAGTGKTIVALHRAVFLAQKHPDIRVLLTTFSDALANALGVKLQRLIHHKPRLGERIEVQAIETVAKRLYQAQFGKIKVADKTYIRQLLEKTADHTAESRFNVQFLTSEWHEVVDAWQLKNWEAYRDVIRLGRKTRLPEKQRAVLWSIFQSVLNHLH